MTKKLYGLIADFDGSYTINWYTNETLVDYLLKEEEIYYGNEGLPAVTLNLPDDFDLKSLGTFFIDNQSLEEWKKTFEHI